VRRLKGITELVKLFNCDSQEVQRYATGATRNLIYENMDNKVALIEEGGIPQLVEALKEPDEELHKNITGRKIPITGTKTTTTTTTIAQQAQLGSEGLFGTFPRVDININYLETIVNKVLRLIIIIIIIIHYIIIIIIIINNNNNNYYYYYIYYIIIIILLLYI